MLAQPGQPAVPVPTLAGGTCGTRVLERVKPLSTCHTARQGGDPVSPYRWMPLNLADTFSLRTHAHTHARTAHLAHAAAARVEVSAAGSEHPSHRFVAAEAGKAKQLPSDAGHGRMLYITHSHRENQNSCLPAAQFVSSIKRR